MEQQPTIQKPPTTTIKPEYPKPTIEEPKQDQKANQSPQEPEPQPEEEPDASKLYRETLPPETRVNADSQLN